MFVTRRSRGVTSVIAHRGASRAEPENTLAAFRRAAAMGADMVELDVRRSRDGLLVVHHDPFLPDGRAIALTDAGDLPGSVPSLEAALEACAGMAVNIEIKNDPGPPGFEEARGLSDDVVALILGRGEADRVLVSSFDLPSLTRVRAITPDVATAHLVTTAGDDAVEVLVAGRHQALHPWWQTVTSDLVAQCHESGVAINVWTCDDPEAMVRLAGWGVDGICTNVPDIAVAALRG
jgi:glycerophosphoryl diester phosphodiesterase